MEEVPGEQEGGQGLVEATLTYLAKAIVSHPEDVQVSVMPGEGTATVFRLQVNQEDMGRVIGRHGRIARAIRQVTRAAAAKAGVGALIEIVDGTPPAPE
jgi:predicted RNA-binding protein YlqC (UPF0109 family)